MFIKGNYVSREEFEAIHEATVKILESTGVIFENEYALEVFKSHGARVDGNRVFISRELLDNSLKLVPAEFAIYGRTDKVCRVGKGHLTIAPNGGPIMVRKGDIRKRADSNDFKTFQKLNSSSKVMNMVAPWIIEPEDIPREYVRRYQMAVTLRYTDKPVSGWTTSEKDAEDSIAMTQRYYGFDDKELPVCIGVISAISPLKYDDTMIRAIRVYAEHNQPVVIASCSMPGATSPISIAGTLTVNNAELLAGIVFTQLIKPGLPVIYGNTTGGCDLRYVCPTIGSLEAAKIVLASAGIAEWYNIPCRTGGSLTDSKVADYQAGAESTMIMSSALMTNASWIMQSCGIVDAFDALCYEKYLLDEQNLEILLKLYNGFNIVPNEADLADIVRVGAGGQYLDSELSLLGFKKELYTPYLYPKMPYPMWMSKGAKTAYDNTDMILKERISAFNMPIVDKDQEKVLESFIGSLINEV